MTTEPTVKGRERQQNLSEGLLLRVLGPPLLHYFLPPPSLHPSIYLLYPSILVLCTLFTNCTLIHRSVITLIPSEGCCMCPALYTYALHFGVCFHAHTYIHTYCTYIGPNPPPYSLFLLYINPPFLFLSSSLHSSFLRLPPPSPFPLLFPSPLIPFSPHFLFPHFSSLLPFPSLLSPLSIPIPPPLPSFPPSSSPPFLFTTQQITLIWSLSNLLKLHQSSLVLEAQLRGSSVWISLRSLPPLNCVLTSLDQWFMDLCYKSLWNRMV